MSESELAITMHSFTPHPCRHLGGTGRLVDGLWGYHVQALWLKQIHLLRKALTISKHILMPFLHFLPGGLLLSIETWKPLRCLQSSCCLFPAHFLQHHWWPSFSRNNRHSEFSSSKVWHEVLEGRQGFFVRPDTSLIWIVSTFLPREPGLPIQACFSQ